MDRETACLRRRGLAALSLCVGLALAALAPSPASAETLQDALAQAYLSNPNMLAEQARLRATDESVSQAISQRRPTATGQAAAGYEHSLPSQFGNQVLWQRGVSLDISQPVWTGGRANAAIAQAEFLVAAERANLINVEEQVLLDAATAYLDVWRDQSNLELAQNNVTVLTQALEQAKAQFKTGLATQTDVAQARARLSQAVANARQASAALANSRAFYRNVVGQDPGRVGPAPPLTSLPSSEKQSLNLARLHNPQILLARANRDAAQAGVDLAKAQRMPNVTVSGQVFNANDQQLEGDSQQGAQALVELALPVYQGGSEHSKIRQSRQSLDQSRSQVDAAIRAVEDSTTASWNGMQAARSRVESFASQIRANEIAYRGVVEEQKEGTRIFLDVLNAQQELFQSRVELVNAQRDQAVSAFQLKAAIGELTAEALKLNVDLYDPLLYYDAVREKWWGADIGAAR